MDELVTSLLRYVPLSPSLPPSHRCF
jgi:hypothetical protein